MNEKIIGIMGAMPEEIDGIVQLLENKQEHSLGKRTYYTGSINNIQTVIVFSRWGKVAAAATVTSLVLNFNITELIFTGVAGAIGTELNIGDIVVAKRLIQHDMDARPLMPQFEIPLLDKTFFETDEAGSAIAITAVEHVLENNYLHAVIDYITLKQFNIISPKLFTGDIASGDKFFSKTIDKENLLAVIPSILCVEMEGAAVAQVCYEYDIPFIVIRTISDTADEQAACNFPLFIKNISSKYAVEIIRNIYSKI